MTGRLPLTCSPLARDRAAAIGCCVTICGQAGALQPGYECPSATPTHFPWVKTTPSY